MMKKSIYKILFVIAIIIFLIIVVPLVLFTSSPKVDSKMSVDNETPVKEQQIAGLAIEFEEGITKPEVKAILENCNLTMYRLNYDVGDIVDKYYIIVENNENIVIKDEFKSAPDKKREVTI